MRLTIFGATGGTGTCLVRQALEAGHEVTAVVRDPARLTGPASPQLHAVTADVLDPASIVTSVAGVDAVITAIGPRANGRTTISQDSVHSIIEAMSKAGTRRLITVSGTIAADDGDGPVLRYLLKPLARASQLRYVCADMRRAEAEVRDSQLDWTIMRPPRLTDRPATGHYRTAIDRNPPRAFSLPRADLATCILGLVSDQSAVHRHIGIAL